MSGERLPTFSIIMPAYNADSVVERSLESVLDQSAEGLDFEVIFVDDSSTDATYDIASRLASEHENLRVTKTAANSGPGVARNVGLRLARGSWVIFVDSDDVLIPDGLSRLNTFLNADGTEELDALGFDWTWDAASRESGGRKRSGRYDQQALQGSKEELLRAYLSLRMDGSVIYTAIRRDLILTNDLQFAPGYHEDVDYVFKVYWHARRTAFLDQVIYRKSERPDSIVNTISTGHIDGFLRAWKEIGDFASSRAPDTWQAMLPHYRLGTIGVLATRVREVYLRASSLPQAADLYAALYHGWREKFASIDDLSEPPLETKYGMIAWRFVSTMREASTDGLSKAGAMAEFMDEVLNKSWSCVDLHHSVFLAPDQIRTCCKRFFVDGQMRGDVALLDLPEGETSKVAVSDIVDAKRDLLGKINSGEASDCDGCPFLEFKEWEPLEQLDVKYLSFEYHSVCNLRCSYCSETYYGGMKPRYDVDALVDDLLHNSALENCHTIVWGGGDPVVEKSFTPLITKMVESVPGANQRVLTNSVKYSDTVERLLAEGKATVTTSVDAGTEETFARVRGKPGLRRALANMESYAAASPSSVTIKYIFTEDNASIAEVRAFAALVNEFHLTGCNFQISSDFTKETIPDEVLISMIAMYGLITAGGCRLIFLDDLLVQRLRDMDAVSEEYIKKGLAELGLGHVLADKASYSSVAIWGPGWQAKYLLEKSSFFKDVGVDYFVDSRSSKIGGRYMGRQIFGPEKLLESDIPVVIAAVQNFPLIYKAFVELGIAESRLVRQLII